MAETQSGRTGGNNPPQAQHKHPPEWERDLDPDFMAGQNLGQQSSVTEQPGHRTAHDLRQVHRALSDFPDDELKEIPIVPEGARLEQGATYLDLRDRREFTATGDMAAGPESHYVPKQAVPYPTWNRLRGETNPERLDTGNIDGPTRDTRD